MARTSPAQREVPHAERASTTPDVGTDVDAHEASPSSPLAFETLAPTAPPAAPASPLHAALRRSLLAASLTHVIAGLVYALVLSGAWMRFSWYDGGFVLARFLWLLSCYAWPTALTIGLVVA
ncbi:MAG TPA: hypothetical protein GX403_00105, partial [Rhodocyclaceae bacterium]|nr:hypothetical protein [Rhodocyclaceae bacterium]